MHLGHLRTHQSTEWSWEKEKESQRIELNWILLFELFGFVCILTENENKFISWLAKWLE